MNSLRLLGGIICLAFTFSCTSSKKISGINTPGISKLRFIDQHILPHDLQFRGTTVGGLSGIDYDARNDTYYIISDDRSDRNPMRFYTAKIFVTEKGIDSVRFVDVISLRDRAGNTYPAHHIDPLHSPDPESIRYNAATNELVWSSEGERLIKKEEKILVAPAVYNIDLAGKYKSEFEVPENMRMQDTAKGPRRNGVYEGLSFSDDYKYLFASVEEPLYEDGAPAGSGDSSAWVRFIKFDTRTRKQVAQYAYQIEPIPYPAVPANDFRVNGISEILYRGNNQFIVMERSFSSGRKGNTIRLFLADARHADDIAAVASLDPLPSVKPITKKLLLNMDELGRYIDNVEGITFGPTLPNGHRTLVLVADNNFKDDEETQLFLFEILP